MGVFLPAGMVSVMQACKLKVPYKFRRQGNYLPHRDWERGPHSPPASSVPSTAPASSVGLTVNG